jgi:hypothetical protein
MSYHPIDEAESREQSEHAKREHAQQRERQQAEDVKWLMANAQGQRFLTRLLEETAVFSTAFHTSGQVMALNEGRKQIGYWLIGELTAHTPDAFINLLRSYARS